MRLKFCFLLQLILEVSSLTCLEFILEASGGAAAASGFSITTSTSLILGFSFSGTSIPAGDFVLTNITFEQIDSSSCLENVVISSSNAQNLDVEVGACLELACADLDEDGVCDNDDDCVGEYDECGVCNGSGIADGACDCDGTFPNEGFDCDGNCVVDIDCAGTCGGSAALDECGECNGDGTSCQENTVDILYDSNADIYGFQFNVNPTSTVISASGGAAGDAGFNVTAGSTVLGFSFTGALFLQVQEF